MGYNESNFKNDFNAEKVINEFLRKYFYKRFVDNKIIDSFYHITDSNLQHEGVDTIIVTLDGVEICIDEKAALDYAKRDLGEASLPTFAFEISYLNRSGILTEGWLTNPKYSKTDDYLLIWLWVKPSTKIKYLQCDDILKLEVIVLPKTAIQNHILYSVSGDKDLEGFRRIANRQRTFMIYNSLQKVEIEDVLSNVDLRESEYAMGNFAFSGTNKFRMKWFLTDITKKAEQPLNIVVNKNTLIDLAKSYWVVTPTLVNKKRLKIDLDLLPLFCYNSDLDMIYLRGKVMKIFSMFDGVGGFIVGLENSSKEAFQTLYSNQYEPSRKTQDAYEVGLYRFPDMEHIPTDVALIPNEKFEEMKANGVDMIVGGFPCQDYSVARSKKNELGIEGKKGVLFWEIIRATEVIRPKYLVLENVDRLLKAPSNQRGRDFAIMLAAFNQLGYSVEWRVINAADYGRAQRRRRVFFFVFRNDTKWGKRLHTKYEATLPTDADLDTRLACYTPYIFKDGLFARQFPVKGEAVKKRINVNKLDEDIAEVSANFSDGKMWNSGLMTNGYYYTIETEPKGDEEPIPMKEIVVSPNQVPKEYYIDGEKLEKFKYLRGPKKITRTAANGHTYTFSEGGMSEYDSLELPGRTMLTSEGSVNRSTHLLKIDGKYRLITPIEAERLQDFPDDWTRFKRNAKGEIVEVSDRMRMFFMGNALVTGIVKRIGDELQKIDK